MSLNSLGLGFVFTARDLASGAVRRLERNFLSLNRSVGMGSDRMQVAFRALGVGLATMSAGLVMVGGAFALANASAEFEQSIAAVGAVSNATSAELALLRDAAIDAGLATQFSPTEAALGLRELAAAGFTARQSIELLLPALDLAAGSLGELSPQDAAGLAAQAIHSFGVEIGQASVAVDQMLFSANAFAVTAGELPLAVGIISRGAQTLQQTLPETLAAFGLVKNIIPTVERASSAVSVAMERMANPAAQRALRGIGVAVADAEGNFRPFLDVVAEMAPRLNEMTEAERGAFLMRTFGARALGGINAILTQVTHGIEDQNGQLLQGADAVAHLRARFEDAGGTAARFRDQMLGTFGGQANLLRGSIETLVVVMGEPFAQLLRPAVSLAVDALNAFLDFFRAMPAPVKRAFAAFAVAAGVFLTLVGGAVTAGVVVALFGAALKAIAIAVGVLLVLLGPAIAFVALWAVAIAGLARAFRQNLGGIADLFQTIVSRVQLGFRALVQLFEDGGLSGAVLEELDRAENSGVRQFVIALFRFAFRVQQIWEGIQAGFDMAVSAMAPTFEQLRDAVSELWEELEGLFSSVLGGANDLPSERFRDFGKTIGTALSIVVRWVAEGLVRMVRFTTGFVRGFRAVRRFVQPMLDGLSDAFERLRAAWNEATGAGERNTDSFRAFGEVVGFVFGVGLAIAVATLAGLIDLVALVIRAFHWLGEAIGNAWARLRAGARIVGAVLGSVARRVVSVFTSMAETVRRAFASVVDTVIRLLRRIPAPLLPESLRGIARMPLSTEQPSARAADTRTQRAAARARAAGSANPGAADAADRGSFLERMEAQVASLLSVRRTENDRPIRVQLQVDGQTLAEATHRAEQDQRTRAFTPVPTY